MLHTNLHRHPQTKDREGYQIEHLLYFGYLYLGKFKPGNKATVQLKKKRIGCSTMRGLRGFTLLIRTHINNALMLKDVLF